METVNIHDVKTRLSQLVDKAASGEDVVPQWQASGTHHSAGRAKAPHQVRCAQGQADRAEGLRFALA